MSERPTLSYGIEPKPGSVTYRHADDGSLHVEIIPKSPTQLLPLIAWGVACLLVPVAATVWLWLAGRLEGWWVLLCAFIVTHLLVAFPIIVYRSGRHRLYMTAGPKGLSIWTTQLGDEIRHDWPRERVENIVLPESADGDPDYALHVRLRDKADPVVIPIFRDNRTAGEIADRLRAALGLDPHRSA